MVRRSTNEIIAIIELILNVCLFDEDVTAETEFSPGIGKRDFTSVSHHIHIHSKNSGIEKKYEKIQKILMTLG